MTFNEKLVEFINGDLEVVVKVVEVQKGVQDVIVVIKNLSNPKPKHTMGGSGRSARRSGRAGSGKIGCQ